MNNYILVTLLFTDIHANKREIEMVAKREFLVQYFCYTRDMRRLHATLLHTIEPLNV
jgi:hypothetical protein